MAVVSAQVEDMRNLHRFMMANGGLPAKEFQSIALSLMTRTMQHVGANRQTLQVVDKRLSAVAADVAALKKHVKTLDTRLGIVETSLASLTATVNKANVNSPVTYELEAKTSALKLQLQSVSQADDSPPEDVSKENAETMATAATGALRGDVEKVIDTANTALIEVSERPGADKERLLSELNGAEKTLSEVSKGFSVVSSFLAAVGSPEAAKVFQTGGAVVQIGLSIVNLVTQVIANSIMGFFSSIGSLVSSITALISIFTKQKSGTQMILEAIEALSRKIDKLARDMNDRFDVVTNLLQSQVCSPLFPAAMARTHACDVFSPLMISILFPYLDMHSGARLPRQGALQHGGPVASHG